MTRVDKVAKTLRDTDVLVPHRGMDETASQWFARALDAAGHLLPDLPEPDDSGKQWRVSYKYLPISHVSASGDQVTLRTSYGWWHTDPDEAKSLALALLAAANYAERNQT